MQKVFTFRLFKSTDLDQVIEINHECLPENYTTFFFMDLHERYPKTFIVSEHDEKIVGYIMCRIETGLPSLKRLGIFKKGHVISIAVLHTYRHQGIAKTLMQKAMRNMAYYKAKECYLEVRSSNNEAIQLYQKMGFKISRTIGEYYVDGEDAYVMSQKLPLEALS
jgi:ribosomal-protein-alanine N-acetyltransferase